MKHGTATATDWRTFYREGIQYWQSAQRGAKRPEVFTPVVMHNVVGMAIEKMFMAILMYNRRLPEGHTFGEMAAAVQNLFPLEPKLVNALRYMDELQSICSMDQFEIREMSAHDTELFIEAGEGVERIARCKLPAPDEQ